MKLKLGLKVKSSFINMTVLYITVGIVFLLITALNIYAYRLISGMGSSYTTLGATSKAYRHNLNKALGELEEIINNQKAASGALLEQKVWPFLKEAEKKAGEIRSVQKDLNLLQDIDKLKEAASETYAASEALDRSKGLNKCRRIVQNAIARLDTTDDERNALVLHDINLACIFYIILILGNIVAFAGIFVVIYINDMGFQKKEKRLHMTNANFHAIMQGLDSILITIDNTGIIRSWNANAARYFDLPEKEVLEQNIYEILPIFNQFKNYFNAVFYSMKRSFKYHERMHVNKGPMRVVNILCVPMVPAHQKKGYAEILIKMDDVTSFMTLEEHGVRERCSTLVCQAMDNVIQDSAALNYYVNETIQSLNTFAEERGLTEEMLPYTGALNNALAQIGMVPQKYASTLAKGELNKIQIDLNEMVMYVLRLCLKTFPPSVSVEVSLNETRSWILADAFALSRTFLCLLANAMESLTEMRPEGAQQGGIISVSVEKIAGEQIVSDKIMRFRYATKEPAYWIILISDNGVGIPQEIQSNIYDPFFTTKNRDNHKGLGLSVAINVINDLGGFIDVNSTPDRGTVFKIYLPEVQTGAADSAVSAELNADDSEIVPGEGVILFINDDIFMSRITTRLLEKFGYTVIAASNGFEALDLYMQHMDEIRCVLTNINNSNFSNADIVTNLKAINPDAKAAVMVASEFNEDARRLRELGITHFVKKPYSMPQLSRVVAECIRSAESAS